MTEIDELIGKGKKQITMDLVPIDQAAAYATADAEVVLGLLDELASDLSDHQALELFHTLEMPLVEVLADMEMEGVALDIAYLQRMSRELSQRLDQLEEQVRSAVGWEFNLNSPPQLSEALFERLKIPPPDHTSRTKTGFYSTSADVLE